MFLESRRQKLGINLEFPIYYSSCRIYEDFYRNTSFYHPAAESGTHTADLATGFPSSGPNWQHSINWRENRVFPVGDYTWSATGNGTGPSNPINNDGSGTNQVFNFSGDLTGFRWGRDAATGVYTPSFAKRAKQFGVLRMMDVWRTNEHTDWTEEEAYILVETPGTFTFYHKMLDVAQIVSMCNKFHCSPWICVNHLSWLTPSYWTTLAEQLDDSIMPVYVEFSNEVWNPGFPQYQYLKQLDPSGSGDLWWEVLYPSAPGEYASIMAWHMDQTELMGRAFKAVNPEKFVIVKGCQSAKLSTLTAGLDNGNLFPHRNIDAVAINPYVGGPWSRDTAGATILSKTHEEIVNEGARNDWYTRLMGGTDEIGNFLNHKDIRSGRYRLLGYEGGGHMDNGDEGSVDAHLFDATQSSFMGEFYKYEFIPQWMDRVNDVLCLYKDTGAFTGRDMAWSHMPHETAEDLTMGAPYASDRWFASLDWAGWS